MTDNANDNPTETDIAEAETGFALGHRNAERLATMIVEQVCVNGDLTDNMKTGFMMGFLQYFCEMYDHMVAKAEAELTVGTVN